MICIMKKKKYHISRSLFTWHSYFGLITGIFLLLLGLSGSLLVFMEEQDEWLNQHLLAVAPQSEKLPLDSLYHTITQRYPRLDGIAWMNPNVPDEQAYNFRLYLNDTKLSTYDLGVITLNPYTGAILREGRYDRFSSGLMQWLFQFHFSFHLGMPGAALTAVFGLTMLVSILTGLVVYRKHLWKALTFRVGIKTKNWRTISSGLHRVVGVWSLVFNVVIFFTGFWMNLFAFEKATWENETKPTEPNIAIAQSFDRLYAEARRQMPDLQPSYVYLPTQPKRDFRVSGAVKGQNPLYGTSNSIRFDPQTGEMKGQSRIAEKSVAEKLDAMAYPLHIGTFGGVPMRILYVIVGLTPGLLSITGFLLWWRRKQKVVRSKKVLLQVT